MVCQALSEALPGSLCGQMAMDQQWWNYPNMAGFGMILEPIVFSTDYFCAKNADKETEMRKRSEGDPL